MNKVQSIPEGVSVVMPMLICQDVSIEIEFCKTVFNATELVSRPGTDGKVAHAAMNITGAMIMLECEWDALDSRSPKKDGSSPVVIYVYVNDVDAALEKAKTFGAIVLLPAKDQFWGDRTTRIMDTQGHVWTLSSRIEETTSDERKERWSKIANQ
jgi:PhnB protein